MNSHALCVQLFFACSVPGINCLGHIMPFAAHMAVKRIEREEVRNIAGLGMDMESPLGGLGAIQCVAPDFSRTFYALVFLMEPRERFYTFLHIRPKVEDEICRAHLSRVSLRRSDSLDQAWQSTRY